jgi:N6-L-threonylcarbamoyladenine synthase
MTLLLGLETSCDETAAAVVAAPDHAARLVVRSSVVATQHELHAEYRGVVPEIASRAHLERVLPVVERALHDAGVAPRDLDAIAVGNRPGLIGSLIVGVSAAKALAWALDRPLVGVDHVTAHLVAGELESRNAKRETGSLATSSDVAEHSELRLSRSDFPRLGLVVSGGHTTLYRMIDADRIERLGGTLDDAIGEAFDKAAVVLGLPYPGGPEIDRVARDGDPHAVRFPRSMLGPDSLDFSFSGLKTAVLYAVRGRPVGKGRQARFERDPADLDDRRRADLAASFQAAAVDAVIAKLERALRRMADDGTPARSIVIGGGVSANSRLRADAAALARRQDLPLILPAMRYCVDNAAMIAAAAARRLAAGHTDTLGLPVAATGSA